MTNVTLSLSGVPTRLQLVNSVAKFHDHRPPHIGRDFLPMSFVLLFSIILISNQITPFAETATPSPSPTSRWSRDTMTTTQRLPGGREFPLPRY